MTEPVHILTEAQLSARDEAVTRRALQMAASYCDQLELKHAQAILALQPAPTRWQEVPEGSVVVPMDKA